MAPALVFFPRAAFAMLVLQNLSLERVHILIIFYAHVSLANTFANIDDIQHLPLQSGENCWNHGNQHHLVFAAFPFHCQPLTWHAPQTVKIACPKPDVLTIATSRSFTTFFSANAFLCLVFDLLQSIFLTSVEQTTFQSSTYSSKTITR